MKYVGIDLHKQTISVCVIVKVRGKKKVLCRKRLECRDEVGIVVWLKELGEFEIVVEATARYQWFVKLAEPLAHRVLLAHPKKLRIIAESIGNNLGSVATPSLTTLPASSLAERAKHEPGKCRGGELAPIIGGHSLSFPLEPRHVSPLARCRRAVQFRDSLSGRR